MYTALAALYAVIRTAYEVIICWKDGYACTTYSALYGVVLGTIGCILCGVFLLFCSVMFFDQISMRMNDTSTIDQMQSSEPVA